MGCSTPNDPEVAVARPFDLVPDVAGKVGYLDDARVVELVWNRIDKARNAFGAAQD